MTALTNGIALHGGFVPFSATFLMFMEYARNAVRLAALMGIRATCSSTPTIPSRSAKTAPRTSRSSS